MNYWNARGATQIEVLVLAVCATLLIVITSVVVGGTIQEGQPGAMKQYERSSRDAKQLKEIHHAFIIFSREVKGRLPTPGLIDRLPTDIGGGLQEIPGRGKEDVTQNTTADMYSMLIMRHYFTPKLVVSPIERSPKVSVCEDYDHAKYDPLADDYWDPNFKADLKEGSNASYAHLIMFGKRKDEQWSDTMNEKFPVLGNRGPKDGIRNSDSITCGQHGSWAGLVVFNDNHIVMLKDTTPPDLKFLTKDKKKKQDNLFAIDDGIGGSDAILAFTKLMKEDGPVMQYD